MEFKRLAAIPLLFSVLLSQGTFIGAYGIEENKTKIEKPKKSQIQDKTNYINLNFWNNYNDPNLSYFILRCIQSNHDLKIAASNSDIYRHYITMQRAEQLPTAGAGFAPGYNKMPSTSDYNWSFAFPLYVNYEADIFLKNRDKTKSAKKSYEMSLLDEEGLYISTASMVGTIYFNVLRLNKAIELQKEIVDLRKQTYELMDLSNKEGIISIQDVIRANKAYIQGGVELIDLQKKREQLINNLAVLIGENPENKEGFLWSDIENVEYKGEIPASINSKEIVERPDYKKAQINVEKTGIDIRTAKKEFLPTINITGLALFNAGDLGSLFTTKNALVNLGGALVGDLFTGGRKFANLKIKKSTYEIALQNYEKTNLEAIQEVNDALVAIKHDKIKYNENKRQNSLETKDFALRELRYKEGVVSKLELIQSKENLLVTKKLVLSDKADCFIDYIGLYKALGAKLNG